MISYSNGAHFIFRQEIGCRGGIHWALHDQLAALNCTHSRASQASYEHHVYRDGAIVFTGTATDVAEWIESGCPVAIEVRS